MERLQEPIGKLPIQPTPFIGRSRELAEIGALLAEPACRLLTLYGPGGIGKTRLALEAARQQEALAVNVAFVALQTATDADEVVTTIAAALGLPLGGSEQLATQLLRVIQTQRLLLVLDNLEHLLDSVALLSDLLAAAPEIKLLVTSREVLNVQEEWRYPVEGLGLPSGNGLSAAGQSSAVQLFGERARRVRHDFQLATEQEAVVRICRLVEGMPLAIEIAAAWIKSLSCAEIAAEIACSLQFLTTTMRNMPERHRSVHAVLDQSWAQLSAEERRVFGRLAVFQGGFSHTAAEQVAGAWLPQITSLVDKSLLRRDAAGHYHLHELLRQYASQQLHTLPAEEAQAQQAHAAFYCDLLADQLPALTRGDQIGATQLIADELANIQAAFGFAIQNADSAALARTAHPLFIYYHFRGPYLEGIGVLDAAARALRRSQEPIADQALAAVLVDVAWLHIRLGQLIAAQAALDESQALYQQRGLQPAPGMATDPLIGQTVLALIRGDYAQAARLGQAALERAQAQQHVNNLPHAYFVLAEAARMQGLYTAAQQYAQQAFSAVQAAGDRWYVAYVHSALGQIAVALGDYAAAGKHFQASFGIREAFNDPEGMAVAQLYQGKAALAQNAFATAREHFERSYTTYARISDRGGLARALNGLGATALGLNQLAEARGLLAEALGLAWDIPFLQAVLATMANACELLLRGGQPAQVVELLVLLLRHPASDRETGEQALRLLSEAERQLEPHSFAAAHNRGQVISLEAAVEQLQRILATEPQLPSAPVTPVTPPAPQAASLIEPLTEREREVLDLVASGCSNQQIADRLILSVGTVKWYVSQILGKLEAQSRTQAIARAREIGLIP